MRPDRASAEVFVNDEAQLGEGPTWFAADERLRWVDILGGRLFSARVDGTERNARDFPHTVSAVVPRVGGGLAVAGDSGVLLLDADGALEGTHPVEPEVVGNRLGDVGVDPTGRLWLGTLDRELLLGRGGLYRLDPDGTLTQVLRETSVANGLGWSPDGSRMYFIDSATFRVDLFDYDVSDGSATERRPWVTVDHADGSPDGLAVDAEGGVWVALFGGGQVRRYAPDGTLDAVVSLPVRQVTSCCFGGPDLDLLFVTTARVELDERSLLLEPLAGSVFVSTPGVTGLPQAEFCG
jgi:sugar lactone lactonase YvrE